ncbi:methyltransferase, FkbM family [Sedimentisphaera cyanobacteriorum]|uniref:Methyltransferase, FkbM family n=1 Tax=Sedimentisphaera cyanobacteriorum TaxID=1940790 RepID=A0A1Q2HPB4_9BACT|nr:FkbM family methyltransferase [Sedimentisphaera cyanobacteriorum]AQQ09297.1 methyltransferase, FkbM family [Sedimentisphaera cyanobacteriorum]
MDLQSDWGKYRPTTKGDFISRLISMGLSRGSVRKKLYSYWVKSFGPIIDCEIRGIKYRLKVDDNLTDKKLFFSRAEKDNEEIDFLSEACSGKTFVDIGANIGYYSLTLAKQGASRVAAVEPNPEAIGRLNYNIKINGFDSKVSVAPFGAADGESFELDVSGNLGIASICNENKGEKTIKIQTKPLIEILAELKVESIGGLKIDIEGAEDKALAPFLKAAENKLLPEAIVLELAHKNCWQEDLQDMLVKSGYNLVRKTNGNGLYKKNKTQ